MYEHRTNPLITPAQFARRVVHHVGIALSFLIFGLGIGILGYHYLAGLGWTDSFLNAAMILAGMGPVDPLPTVTAKVFAGCYALFSGLAYVGIASLLIAPFAHRILHRLHLDDD